MYSHSINDHVMTGSSEVRSNTVYGVKSWIGVLDRSYGLEYWSGFLEWNFGVKYSPIFFNVQGRA